MDYATLMQDVINTSASTVGEFIEATGKLYTVQGETLNATTHLKGPPYTTKAEDVPFTVASISNVRDPDLKAYARTLNVSMVRYRLLTAPIGFTEFEKNDRIVEQPVTGSSNVYQVIEAVAPDETTRLEMVLHCQRLNP